MRSQVDSIVTEKVLHHINIGTNYDFPDDVSASLGLKNVCTKVSQQLSDEIDEVCVLLGLTKRAFLEAAFIDAVAVANEIISREGFFESMEQPEKSS